MIQFLFVFVFLFAFSIAQQGNDHILLNQLSSSTGFTCFITRYENLRCWGYERRFAYLGHGNITNVGLNDKTPTIREQGDIDLGENVKVKSVATGETATCVLLQDETVKCWGNGIDGVLGDGSDSGSGSKIPKDLPAVNISAPVKQLAMGYNHVCVVLELKSPTESNVKCWGKNDYGQLGFSTDNVTSYGNTPETIPALLPFVPLDGPVFMIAASQRHTCAVMEVTRDIKCWGDNSYAQLGAPSLTVQQLVPPVERVPLPPGQYGYVATGPRSSCAIEENARALYCWGTGSDGQLGYGGTTNLAGAMNSSQSFAVGTGGAVKFPDGAQVTKVTIGAAHTCALLGTGDVSCFGRNVTGQLGAPIPDAGATPTTTPDTYDPVVLPLSVTALSAGFDHSCAELKNGDLYCWGSAQLGATGFNDMDKTVGASFETLPITHGLVDVGDDVITTTTEFVSTTTTTEQPTTISETTSRTFSDIDLTPTKAPEEEEDLWWLWLLIAILVCCCLICLLLLILFLRRRNKDDEQEDSQRRKGDDVGLRPGTAVYVEQDQQPQAVVVDSSSSSSSSSSYSSSDSEEQRRERKSHKKKSKKSRKKRSNQ